MELANENFNSIEFDRVKNESGTNTFVMTPKKWIKATNAIGIISKQSNILSKLNEELLKMKNYIKGDMIKYNLK